MNDDRIMLRRRDFAIVLREAIESMAADYSDCDLTEAMHDAIVELGQHKNIDVLGLTQHLQQWLEEK